MDKTTRLFFEVAPVRNEVKALALNDFLVNKHTKRLCVMKFCKFEDLHKDKKIRRDVLMLFEKYADYFVIVIDDILLKYNYFFPCGSTMVAYMPNIKDYKCFVSWKTLISFITDESCFPSEVENLIVRDCKNMARMYIGENQRIYDEYNDKVNEISVLEVTSRLPAADTRNLDEKDGYDSPVFHIPSGFRIDYNQTDLNGVRVDDRWTYRHIFYKKVA